MRFVASVVIKPSGEGLKPLRDEADNAARSLKTASNYVGELEGKITGLKEAVTGLGALIAFDALKNAIRGALSEASESRESFAQLEAGVRSTGGAAGLSAEELRKFAEQEQKLTGLQNEVVEGGEAVLLTFTRIGRQVFPEATKAALDLAARMKEDVSTAALQLGKALNDPIAGATALRRIGVQLSDSQVELIKKFAVVHDVAGAQKVILAELNKEFGGSAVAAHLAKGGLDDLENAGKDLLETLGNALFPAITQLAKELSELANNEEFQAEVMSFGHSLGEVILVAGHGAEFLLTHWEAVKLVFIAFIALKAPAYIMEVVEAVKALTIASRAAALANPLAWVAVGLFALNEFVVKMRNAEDAALQANVTLATQGDLVAALATDYGKLTAAQLENAKAQIDQLKARDQALQQQREDLLRQAGYSQAGQTPGREAPPSVRNIDQTAVESILKQEAALREEQKNIQNIIGNLSPILEEHEKHIKTVASATSDWGLKTKQTTDFLAEAEKVLRSFADKLDDLISKLARGVAGQQALFEALDSGILGYNLAKLALERSNAVEAVATQLAKDHRAELEKLADIEAKARAAGRNGDADKIHGEIETSIKLNFTLGVVLEDRARKEIDLKQAVTAKLAVLQEDRRFSEELRTAQAGLADAISGTSAASRQAATSLEIERAQLAANAIAGLPLAASIAHRIQLRHDELNAIKDQSDAMRALHAVEVEAARLTSINQIQTQDPRLREIETQYIDTLTRLTGRTVEETRILFESLGIDFEAFSANLKASLGAIADQKLVASLQGASKTPFEQYREERANIERIMRESAGSVAHIVEDGNARLRELEKQHYDALLSDVSSALGYLSDQFGGFFSKLSQLVQNIQGGLQAGQNIQGIASNLGASSGTASSIGGAAGGAFAMVAVLRAIYEWDKAQEEAARLRQYTLGGVATGRRDASGNWGISGVTDSHGNLTQQSRDASNAINSAMLALADAIGGTLKQFQYIEIKVRNDGKYFQAIVGQELIGTFDTQKAATDAALRAALLSTETIFNGLAGIVKQGLQELRDGLTGQTFDIDQIKDFLGKLKQISDLGKSQGQIQLEGTLKGFDDLWQTLSRLKNLTPEVAQGFQNLVGAEVSAWEAWRRSITGVQETRAEQLADKQREAQLFNDEKKLRIAELRVRVEDLKAQAAVENARARIVGAGGHIDHTEIEMRAGYLSAKAKLLEIDGGLTTTYLSLIQAQIDAILKIIADLEAIPDINPGDVRLPRSGGHGANDNRQSALDHLQDLQLAGASDIMRTYVDSQRAIRDWDKQAKEAHLTQAQLAEGERLIREQRKQSIQEALGALAGMGTDFTKSLADGMKSFADARTLGRKETGIPNWLLDVMEGKFLDKMKANWQAGVNSLAGISDPFAQINSQADELRQNLVALAKASGISADQVLAASVALDKAVAMAKQAASYQLEDKLFEPLKDLPEWQGKIVELKKAEVELQYEILKAQLIAAGLWDKDKGVWQASHDAAIAIAAGAGKLADATDRAAAIQADRNMVAGYDLVAAQKQAAEKFRDLVKGLVNANQQLLTGSQSSLSPQAMYQRALADYQNTLTLAQSGNVQALSDIVGIRSTLLSVAQQYFAGGAGEGLSGGYAQLLNQTLQDFANLALSPNVEQQTMANLLAQANTTAEASAAQTHADLVALRQAVLLTVPGTNVIGGSGYFQPPPPIPVQPVANNFASFAGFGSPGSGSAPDNSAVVRELAALRQEVAALRKERKADAGDMIVDLDKIAANADDDRSSRQRARVQPTRKAS